MNLSNLALLSSFFFIMPQLSPVYEKNWVIFEWFGALKIEVYKQFSNPATGEPLLFIAPEPIYVGKPISYAINKMSPWAEKLELAFQW